ncbi:tRNA pseudouridine synthase [Wickerhamomyces ciferrii]|uniref:tRNA pseudouridine synthase n=1 Tax=Wickerhamomyces ciferrii (strain ATCC 14091 / BCRC 22168 / CBS 111 / JCM 3599 / NBRC 0793 / NRRL Y-1031 F-60-10) TaxID=1206466 RepID=K0KJL9_WICCF|nr:tRNA pseudouridine synthase [Wickerhamomyces ciferrii]CCH42322.1 tRNA pseudouridine synthase [Wickerhamomyces ciferrii]
MTNKLEMFPLEIKVLLLERFLVETNDILNYLQVVPSMNYYFKANFKVVSDEINQRKYNKLPEGCLISYDDFEDLLKALSKHQMFKGIVLMEFYEYIEDFQQLEPDYKLYRVAHERTKFRYTFYGSFFDDGCSYKLTEITQNFCHFDPYHKTSHINFPDIIIYSPEGHLPNTEIEINFLTLKTALYEVPKENSQTFDFNIMYCTALKSLNLLDLHDGFIFPKSFMFPKNLKLSTFHSSYNMEYTSQWLFKPQRVQNLEHLSLEDSRNMNPKTISIIDVNFPKMKEFKVNCYKPRYKSSIIFQKFKADLLENFSISSSNADVKIDDFRAQNIKNFTILANSCTIENLEEPINMDSFKIYVNMQYNGQSIKKRKLNKVNACQN